MHKILIATATSALVALPLTPALASGGDDAEVRTGGQCTGSARWELKVKEDDGGVEVEFEVDSNVTGQDWTYELTGPGGLLSSGTRTTTGPSGSFSVEVKAAGSVTDTFTGTAAFGGQTCDSTGGSVIDDRNDDSSDDDSSDDRGRGEDRHVGTCTDDSVAAALTVRKSRATLRVDSDSRGEKWRYEIRRDGRVLREGVGRTKGKKALLKVSAKRRGAGSFTASAEKVGSDDSCRVHS